MKCIIKNLILLTFGSVMLASCYEDKGNYNYDPPKELEISIIGDYVRILGNDTITIRPSFSALEQENTDPGDYTYEWVWYNAKIGQRKYNAYVVSREKELNGQKLGLPRGTHKFYYKVIDRNGISFFSDLFKITVESDIARGFMILSDVDNKTRMDYLNYSAKGEITQIVDIFDKMGTTPPEMGRPLGVTCYYDNNAPIFNANNLGGYHYGICIMTTEGAFRVKHDDLSYLPEYDFKEAFTGKLPNNFMISQMFSPRSNSASDSGEAVVYDDNNRNLYYMLTAMMWTWNSTRICNTLGGVRFNAAPHYLFGFMMGVGVLFDEDTKSFMNYMMGTTSAYIHPDLNDTGKDLLMLGKSADDMMMTLALMKKLDGSQYYLLTFSSMGGFDAAVHDLTLLDGGNAADFCKGTYHPNRPYIYYRTDTKVYVINAGTLSVNEVYSAPAGHKISRIKIVRNGGGKTDDEPLWVDDLMICTYDPSLPAESCGTFSLYKPIAQGALELEKLNGKSMTWSGFGKIVDADFKQK